MATVKAKSNFDPEEECTKLRTAMKGLGTDTNTITEVIGFCNNEQRQQLRFHFAQMFGKVLLDDLKSELSGNFRKLVKALILQNSLFDANELRNAMKGIGTNEKCLIQILTTKNNKEMAAIKEDYTFEIRRNLQDDLQSETSNHFKRLMFSLSNGMRDEDETVDKTLAKAEAAELREAGIAHVGTDESTFNRILCTHSHAHLRRVFVEYKKLTGQSIIKSIKSEMSGNLRDGMIAMVKVIINPATYFAQELHASMKGLGTDNETLIRIIVSRSEIDLQKIKNEFLKKYGETLTSWIEDDTSGDYRKLLLKIIGSEQRNSNQWEQDELWSSDEE